MKPKILTVSVNDNVSHDGYDVVIIHPDNISTEQLDEAKNIAELKFAELSERAASEKTAPPAKPLQIIINQPITGEVRKKRPRIVR